MSLGQLTDEVVLYDIMTPAASGADLRSGAAAVAAVTAAAEAVTAVQGKLTAAERAHKGRPCLAPGAAHSEEEVAAKGEEVAAQVGVSPNRTAPT